MPIPALRGSKKAPLASPSAPGKRVLRYVAIGLGSLCVLDALVGDRGVVAIVKARQDYQRLEASLEKTRGENTRLRERARLLREDADTVERVAREQLGLMMPGERLFILKDVKPAKP